MTRQPFLPRFARLALASLALASTLAAAARSQLEPLFKPWVEDRAPALASGARALIAHPAAARDLASVPVAAEERVVLAVGPEGGFIAYEVEALERAGFLPVTLGPRRLRVETAAVALLAQVDLLRRLGAAHRTMLP